MASIKCILQYGEEQLEKKAREKRKFRADLKQSSHEQRPESLQTRVAVATLSQMTMLVSFWVS